MDLQKLAQFYNSTYTRQELAEVLAGHVLEGSLPPVPDLPEQASAPVGRPSKAEFEAKLDLLADLLELYRPDVVDLATLSARTGLHRATLEKLQRDPNFALEYGSANALYLASLPITSHSRLTPLYRVALDLHNYRLMMMNSGQRLPLYTWHSVLFGKPLADPARVSIYNSRERARAIKLSVDIVGWEILSTPTENYLFANTTDCPVHGCDLCKAYRDDVDLTYIPNLRRVVGWLPWATSDREFITGKTYQEILNQVVGK